MSTLIKRATTLCFSAALPFAASTADSAYLTEIRAAKHNGHTRIVLDTSEQVQFQKHVREKPPMLEILMENMSLATDISAKTFAGTPITSAKAEGMEHSGLQLVFDLSARQRIETFALGPYEERGNRIVIDIYPTSEDAMVQRLQSDTPHAMAHSSLHLLAIGP